jgi:hypothetical protein
MDENSSMSLVTTVPLSERFFEVVLGTVEFGGFASDSLALRDRIVRLVAYDRTEEALRLVCTTSNFGDLAARALIERVESACDRVFYATGLRPSLAGSSQTEGR